MTKLYTESELCQLLDLSRTTVWRLRKNGALRAVRFGRTVRYSQEQIDELVKRMSAENHDAAETSVNDSIDKIAA
ncbi:MAG: helix-turn-helix domain-containing protein [Blastocatellia bacterium]